MKKRSLVLFRHLLVWLIFIAYEMSLIQITVGLSASVFHYVIFYALNICLFYFNAHVILDFAFFKTHRPYLVSSLLILLEIIGYLAIKLELDNLLSGSKNLGFMINPPNEKLWLANVWREIFFIGFSIAYWSMLYMVRFKERNHVMETEQLKAKAETLELENKYISAENAYLQNQISPHLLFNSLNFIYQSIRSLSDRAGKGVMLLADIMRYSLVSSEDNRTVELTKEVEQIEKLIELSHLRYPEELFVKFRKKGKLKDIQIIPLILITLVENMIKHGDLGDAAKPASIRLEKNENGLVFETKNKKRTGTPHAKGGLGLKNIEKRLQNHYQHRFTLNVLEDEHQFTVLLLLNL
ncbi:MAG TPA: histidine kinase [Mucilaginibacter sp.]|nr:histidine kinase [Mucilaginibacter sp.]